MISQEDKLLKKIAKEKAIRVQIELEGRREKEPNLLNISRAIDEYYCLNKIKLYCAYLSYKNINSGFIEYDKNDFLFLKEIIDNSIIETFNNPIIKTYNSIRLLLEAMHEQSEEEESLFLQLSNNLPKLIEAFSNEEKVNIYSFLTNYCTSKFNNKQNHYLKHILFYNVQIINVKIKTVKKKEKFLPPTTFRNIVTTALHLKDDLLLFKKLQESSPQLNLMSYNYQNGIEWTEAFIKEYKDRLNEPYGDSYYRYSLALVLFHKDQFGKAYRVLGNPFRLQGMFINLNTRMLHLVILYELFNMKPIILENDEIDIRKVLENFRSLIRDDQNRKKQLNLQYLLIYKDFEKLFKRLYNLNIKYRGLKPKPTSFFKFYVLLKTDIEKTVIPFKSWMLKKLHELES